MIPAMATESSPRVLIVGAGPTGLFAACELARYGVSVRIIDRAPARSAHSKALGVQARSLEVLDQGGIAETLIERGLQVRQVQLAVGKDRPRPIKLEPIESRYPFLLIVPQSVTEEVLETTLQSRGVQVERGSELVLLQDKDKHVAAGLRTKDDEELEEFDWIIGCDGAHSTVRDAVELPFEGSRLPEEFILADAELRVPWEAAEPVIRLADEGPFVLIPLPDGQWRIIAQVPHSDGDAIQDVGPGEVEAVLDARRQEPLKLGTVSWSSRFRIHRRIVPTFRHERVFLAGDAAHLHSPVGGQGMNLGLQDAHNIAWKIALVTKGFASVDILDSYDAERRPIAQKAIDWTTRATQIVTAPPGALQTARNLFVKLMAGTETAQRHLAHLISQTGFDCRKSPIVGTSDTGWYGLNCGDYAGNIRLARNPGEEGVPLARMLTDDRHLVLIEDSAGNGVKISRKINARYGKAVRAFAVNPRKSTWPDAESYAVISNESSEGAMGIVRPDGYLGAVAKQVDEVVVERFLQHSNFRFDAIAPPEMKF